MDRHLDREAVSTDHLTVDIGAWAHMVRNALRMKRWQEASVRRMDMNGLEHGVDRDATNLLWRSQTGKAAGVLRGLIAGPTWTQDRRCRAKFVTTAVSPFVPPRTSSTSTGAALVGHPPAAPRCSIRSRPHLPPCLTFCGP